MVGKPKPKTKEKSLAASPQILALNPMVGMVGMASWSEIMKEGLDFASVRMERDMQAQRDLLNCKSIEDVLKFQAAYFQDAAEQYTRQFQRLAELLSEATALGWSEATARRAREYDDIPL